LSQYYFTVASLPSLDLSVTPQISMDQFIEVCRSTLSPEDLEVVESAAIDSFPADCDNAVLNRWMTFEQSLRNELVKLRAPGMGVDSEKYVRRFIDDTTTPAIASAAFKTDDPLKAEEYLDTARWNFLEELEVGHVFDIERIIIYSLKLQILERRKLFTIQKGKDNFQNSYEQIKTAIRNV